MWTNPPKDWILRSNFFKFQIIDYSHVLGFDGMERRIEELQKNSNKLKISYLNYQNSTMHNKTQNAVENLHKFFDQNLKHLIMDRVSVGVIFIHDI